MSSISVNEIYDKAGTGGPTLPNGIAGGLTLGGDLTLDTNGIYLGGTGSANYLDDYEEGTWAPTLAANRSGGPSEGSNPTYDGYYTKVGNVVTCYASLDFDSTNSVDENDFFELDGLPFTKSSNYNINYYGFGTLAKYWGASSNENAWGIVGIRNNNNIVVKIIFVSGTEMQYNNNDEFDVQQGGIGITFTYLTDD